MAHQHQARCAGIDEPPGDARDIFLGIEIRHLDNLTANRAGQYLRCLAGPLQPTMLNAIDADSGALQPFSDVTHRSSTSIREAASRVVDPRLSLSVANEVQQHGFSLPS